MDMLKAHRALKEVARKNDVPLALVLKEIESAIAVGMANPDPVAQAFWREAPWAGKAPTPVEFIAYLSETELLQQKPGSDRKTAMTHFTR